MIHRWMRSLYARRFVVNVYMTHESACKIKKGMVVMKRAYHTCRLDEECCVEILREIENDNFLIVRCTVQ